MRIVVAGTGGFARILAFELAQTANALLILSRTENPELAELFGCQVAAVDYYETGSLTFLLQGVNLVISTIPGTEQLSLINASKDAGVDRFIPSEFEGQIGRRPDAHDDLYSAKMSLDARTLLRRLHKASNPLKYTVFSCGMFYERFAPGGLSGNGMGASFEYLGLGDYMIDLEQGTAQIPATNPNGRSVSIALTSAHDVARMLCAALDLGLRNWPREFKMYGARMSSARLVETCSEVRGMPFEVREMSYAEIAQEIYTCNLDPERFIEGCILQHLLQTASGRYSMDNEDDLLQKQLSFRPMGFRTWLQQAWATQS